MNVLYHASTNKNLPIITPQRTLSKDRYIGDYVFATSDKLIATMYLVTRGTPILMNVKSEKPRIIICADQNHYISNDKGGAIYTVSADNFKKTPQLGLEESELVSEVSIVPLQKIVFSTSLEALHEAGVNVYFVSQSQFDEIINEKNEAEVIARLVPYCDPKGIYI